MFKKKLCQGWLTGPVPPMLNKAKEFPCDVVSDAYVNIFPGLPATRWGVGLGLGLANYLVVAMAAKPANLLNKHAPLLLPNSNVCKEHQRARRMLIHEGARTHQSIDIYSEVDVVRPRKSLAPKASTSNLKLEAWRTSSFSHENYLDTCPYSALWLEALTELTPSRRSTSTGRPLALW